MPNGRLSSSSLASTTAARGGERGQLLERGEHRSGRLARARPGLRPHGARTDRALRRPVRAAGGRAARRAMRPNARRARSAAPAGTSGCGAQDLAREPAVARRPLRRRGTDRVRRARRHSRSSARATHTPNSGPTSGLVTKSRPGAARAVTAREEAALSVEGGLHEPVEGDRALAVDHLREVRGDGAHVSPSLARLAIRTRAHRPGRRSAGRCRPRPRRRR